MSQNWWNMMMYRKRTSVSNHNGLTALDVLFYREKNTENWTNYLEQMSSDTEQEIATLWEKGGI